MPNLLGFLAFTLLPVVASLALSFYAWDLFTPPKFVGLHNFVALMRDLCAANDFLRYDETPPATKSVTYSNVAAVNVTDQDGVAVVTVAVDNLVKGGAGQAVQAANVRFGLEETAGLLDASPWP